MLTATALVTQDASARDRRVHVVAQEDAAVPLARAHAHNVYEHERPIFDALSHGFTSVEADVWFVNGERLMGHELGDQRGR